MRSLYDPNGDHFRLGDRQGDTGNAQSLDWTQPGASTTGPAAFVTREKSAPSHWSRLNQIRHEKTAWAYNLILDQMTLLVSAKFTLTRFFWRMPDLLRGDKPASSCCRVFSEVWGLHPSAFKSQRRRAFDTFTSFWYFHCLACSSRLFHVPDIKASSQTMQKKRKDQKESRPQTTNYTQQVPQGIARCQSWKRISTESHGPGCHWIRDKFYKHSPSRRCSQTQSAKLNQLCHRLSPLKLVNVRNSSLVMPSFWASCAKMLEADPIQ